MKFNATPISYRSTGLFSALINDYIETKGTAQSFVNYAATKEGYKKAIEQRASFPTNRKVLVEVLQNQYTQLAKDVNSLNNKEAFKLVNDNVSLLLKENTFTVTTAHQPNIFTGPLYFIYKIVHAIGNTILGGLYLGLFNFSYHLSGCPILPLKNPPIIGTKSHNKYKSNFILIFI